MKNGIPISTALSFDESALIHETVISGNFQYICHAMPGTGTNRPGWRIRRVELDIDGNPARSRMANGTASFCHIADNYADYSYS